MSANWLDQVRASLPQGWDYPTMERLLACAEALAELVALHDDPQRAMGPWLAAWERARRAVEGGE